MTQDMILCSFEHAGTGEVFLSFRIEPCLSTSPYTILFFPLMSTVPCISHKNIRGRIVRSVRPYPSRAAPAGTCSRSCTMRYPSLPGAAGGLETSHRTGRPDRSSGCFCAMTLQSLSRRSQNGRVYPYHGRCVFRRPNSIRSRPIGDRIPFRLRCLGGLRGAGRTIAWSGDCS